MQRVGMTHKNNAARISKGKKITQPLFMPPMLATLTTNYFSKNDWLYEHKFDGQRCLVVKKNGNVHLMSRNDREINAEYPELVQAFLKQKADNFIVDGEIVALAKGLSDFQLLQSRINRKDTNNTKLAPIKLYLFDVLYIDGCDVRDIPLLERKELLRALLKYNHMLVYTHYTIGNGLALFKKACLLHWEGLIAKKIDSPYVSKRSTYWLKFKCIMQQELVIGGFTSPEGSRTDFGALLVGYYKKGKLYFAGKVGTGFSYQTLAMLGKKMRAKQSKKNPFIDYDGTLKNVHWIKPELVAEFAFAQWTAKGRLRVGRYKGLRVDKQAKEVIREEPKSIIVR